MCRGCAARFCVEYDTHERAPLSEKRLRNGDLMTAAATASLLVASRSKNRANKMFYNDGWMDVDDTSAYALEDTTELQQAGAGSSMVYGHDTKNG